MSTKKDQQKSKKPTQLERLALAENAIKHIQPLCDERAKNIRKELAKLRGYIHEQDKRLTALESRLPAPVAAELTHEVPHKNGAYQDAWGRWMIKRASGVTAYATPNEIDAAKVAFEARQKEEAKEKEWAMVSVLEEGDVCECTRAELNELLVTAKGSAPVDKYISLIPLQVAEDNIKRNASWRAGELTYGDWPGTIPLSHFRRRLLGTIAARKKDEERKTADELLEKDFDHLLSRLQQRQKFEEAAAVRQIKNAVLTP